MSHLCHQSQNPGLQAGGIGSQTPVWENCRNSVQKFHRLCCSGPSLMTECLEMSYLVRTGNRFPVAPDWRWASRRCWPDSGCCRTLKRKTRTADPAYWASFGTPTRSWKTNCCWVSCWVSCWLRAYSGRCLMKSWTTAWTACWPSCSGSDWWIHTPAARYSDPRPATSGWRFWATSPV